MPSSYSFDPSDRVMYVRAHGELTDADLIEQRQRLRAEPAMRVARAVIVDFREVTAVHLTTETVRDLARERISADGARRAIVLAPRPESGTPAPFAFGLGRLYQLTAELQGETVQVFVDMAAARTWLGLDPAEP